MEPTACPKELVSEMHRPRSAVRGLRPTGRGLQPCDHLFDLTRRDTKGLRQTLGRFTLRQSFPDRNFHGITFNVVGAEPWKAAVVRRVKQFGSSNQPLKPA